MRVGDYEKFHKKGGEYVIPVEVFNEIIEEIEKLEKKIKGLKGLKLRLITSNTAIKKENERLNKELENLKKLNNANYQSFIEVNNIINQLEKEFEEELKNLNYSEDKIYAQGIHDTIISHKYKLQELKGRKSDESKAIK